jgi:hypothetical protein
VTSSAQPPSFPLLPTLFRFSHRSTRKTRDEDVIGAQYALYGHSGSSEYFAEALGEAPCSLRSLLAQTTVLNLASSSRVPLSTRRRVYVSPLCFVETRCVLSASFEVFQCSRETRRLQGGKRKKEGKHGFSFTASLHAPPRTRHTVHKER